MKNWLTEFFTTTANRTLEMTFLLMFAMLFAWTKDHIACIMIINYYDYEFFRTGYNH